MKLTETMIVWLILYLGILIFITGGIVRFTRGTDKAYFISTKLLAFGIGIMLVGGIGYFFGLLIMLKFLCFIIPIGGLYGIIGRS